MNLWAQKIRRPDCPLKGTDRLRPCLQKDLSQVMLCPRILLIDLYIFDPMFDPVFFSEYLKLEELRARSSGAYSEQRTIEFPGKRTSRHPTDCVFFYLGVKSGPQDDGTLATAVVIALSPLRESPIILGLHVTSPKIKLRNYRFLWVSTFTRYYST